MHALRNDAFCIKQKFTLTIIICSLFTLEAFRLVSPIKCSLCVAVRKGEAVALLTQEVFFTVVLGP